MALICPIWLFPAPAGTQNILSVEVMDEPAPPAPSVNVAVPAEVTGARGPSQLAAPSGFAQLQHAKI